MLDAEGRKHRAKKASDVAAKRRTNKAKPFIAGVVAAYGFIRFGKPKPAGLRFLVEQEWEPDFDFQIGCDHTAAINLLSAATGKTKTYIRQIIKKRLPSKENHLTAPTENQENGAKQLKLSDLLT